MNLIIEMIGFKIIKTHIIRYKKLDIVRFIMESFPSFSTELEFFPRITLFEIYIEKPHNP